MVEVVAYRFAALCVALRGRRARVVSAGALVAALVPTLALAQVSAGAVAPVPANGTPLMHFAVEGDGIPASLTGVAGDAARGRAIVADRQTGLCLLCHAAPIPEQRFQGNLGPDLSGTGARWSVSQLRLRMVDARRLNPESVMPSYYRVDGLTRVAPALRGKSILSAQQIEDVVAYLASLQSPAVSRAAQNSTFTSTTPDTPAHD